MNHDYDLYDFVINRIKLRFEKTPREIDPVEEVNNLTNEELLQKISSELEEILLEHRNSIEDYIDAEIHKAKLELEQ